MNRRWAIIASVMTMLVLAFAIPSSPQVFPPTKKLSDDSKSVQFAVIGDYGSDAEGEGDAEKSVAKMVKGWDPDFIITLGDNNYPNGKAKTIVQNIGNYYCDYIYNEGAPDDQQCEQWATERKENLFFPSLGNHDWNTPDAKPYIAYFTKLPGNKRYYDFVQGPVHFFVLDSQSKEACDCDDPQFYEPDGTTPDSRQGQWLREKLQESNAPWKIVYFHHAPYTCKGDSEWMQWPFQDWGANAVLSGHKHLYERGWLTKKPTQRHFPYFVNGTGGIRLSKCHGDRSPGFEEIVIEKKYGAMWVKATPTKITFEFYDAETESRLDRCKLTKTSDGQGLYCEQTTRSKGTATRKK